MRDLGDRIGTVVGKAQTFNSEVDIINKQRELVTENISRDGGATYHDLQKVNQKALDFAVDTSVTAFIETPMLVDEALSNVNIAVSVGGLVMGVTKSATKTAPKAYANALKNAEEGQLKSLASKRNNPGMVYHQPPRPPYEANPQHIKGTSTYKPGKTPEPGNAAEVFKTAVQDPTNPGTWYAIFGKNIYMFASKNNITAHFTGYFKGAKGTVKNMMKKIKQWMTNQ